MKPLKHYIEQLRGISYKKGEEKDNPILGYIPLLRSNNIVNGNISFEKLIYIKKEKVNEKQLLKKGDILVTASTGSLKVIGKNAALKEDFNGSFGAFCKVIRPGPNINAEYLKHFFKSPNYFSKIRGVVNGANINNIKNEHIDNLQIPLPPLSTQKKIADILDTADELRQKTQAVIDHYDHLAQSLFLEMFGDPKGEKKYLSAYCQINPKKSEISEWNKKTLVSFVPMANISDKGELILEKNKTLSHVWNGFTYFKENDVAFAKITPCMENGKGCILRGLTNNIGFGSTEFHVLRPIKGKTTAEWLFYLTKNRQFRKQAELNMTGSAGQKRVPRNFLEKYEIVCPPIELQNQFADRIALIEKQKELAKQSLQESENLFNALLQKAFKGEIEVNETEEVKA